MAVEGNMVLWWDVNKIDTITISDKQVPPL